MPRAPYERHLVAERRVEDRSWLLWAGMAAFALLACATFSIAALMPLYTDEVAWKMIQGRYLLDGGKTISTLPLCSTFVFDAPVLLRPFRLFDALIYRQFHSPAVIRTYGVSLMAAWMLVTWALLTKGRSDKLARASIAVLIVSVSTLGIMPFLMVMSRPEQILLLGITLFAIPVVAIPRPAQRSPAADAAAAFAVILFCGYFFTSHPRAAFALPLTLVFIGYFFVRKPSALIVGAAATLFCLVSVSDWSLRTQCDAPSLQPWFERDSIVYAASNGRLAEYLGYLRDRLFNHPAGFFYLTQLSDVREPTWNLLPPLQSAMALVSSRFVLVVFSAITALGGLAFVAVAVRALRRRRVTLGELTVASLWLFYAASVVARATRSTYEASLIAPVVAMAALGSLWIGRDMLTGVLGAPGARRARYAGFFLLIAASVTSQITLVANYLPYAAGSWARPGYVARQQHSISVLGYESLRPTILETARMCGIAGASTTRHPIVDELTIFALQPVFQPFLATYIDKEDSRAGIGDYRAFLTKLGSGGMVVGCQWVPTQLRRHAVQNGAFCCLPPFGPPGPS